MQINKSGLWGEIYAARWLRDNKYDVLAANYRTRLGEIDIICSKGKNICFVEVKTRGENAIYLPREAVDLSKQDRIIATAMQYIKASKCRLQPRFDVCEIILNDKYEPISIKYIKNAFTS